MNRDPPATCRVARAAVEVPTPNSGAVQAAREDLLVFTAVPRRSGGRSGVPIPRSARRAEVNVTGVAGFVVARAAASRARRKLKTGMTSHSCYCTTITAIPAQPRRQFNRSSDQWSVHPQAF